MQHTSHTQVVFADSAEEAKEKYKNRKTDHWGRNFLDSLCDKGIITDVKYWDSDFESTVENGVFLVLCCNAFGL